MSNLETLRRHREAVLAIAKAHHAGNVRVFGSAARGEDGAASDIDLLVAFGPKTSLFQHAAMERELAALLGRPVDVVSDRGLRPEIRRAIESEAVPL